MKPKATALAIIEKEGKVLLTKRNIEPFKGTWCLPGGHIEEGERAKDAIKREVKEETNLDFEGRFYSYSNEIFPELNWHAVALVFEGNGHGEVRLDEESTEFKWFDLEETDNLEMAFNHKIALKEYKNKEER